MWLIQKGIKKNGLTKPLFGRLKSKGVGGRSNIVLKKRKKKSISKLIEDADAHLSYKVRELNKDGAELPCFTCGALYGKRKLQCGHYITRAIKLLRWHPDNCRPQCVGCNIFKKGNVTEFRINLIKEIGEARVNFLEENRHHSMKLTRPYLENLIKELSV